jgi:hypothetical protein
VARVIAIFSKPTGMRLANKLVDIERFRRAAPPGRLPRPTVPSLAGLVL